MRKSKNIRWAQSLKNLRKTIGKSQQDFAELIGVSLDLIKSVESGRAPVTRKLATKIQVATAAVIGESRIGANGFGEFEPLKNNAVICGWKKGGVVPFTIKAFFYYRQSVRPDRDDLVKRLKIICQAATAKNKIESLRWSFIEWAQDAIERFNLDVPAELQSQMPLIHVPTPASPQSRRSRQQASR